jgi:hypothetical protein
MYVCICKLGETQVRDVMVVEFDSRLVLLVGLGDGHLLTYHIHTSIAVSLEDIEQHQTEHQKLGQVVDQSKFLELALSERRKCVLGMKASTCIYIHTYKYIQIHTYIHTYIQTNTYIDTNIYLHTYIHAYIHTYIQIHTIDTYSLHTCLYTYIHT